MSALLTYRFWIGANRLGAKRLGGETTSGGETTRGKRPGGKHLGAKRLGGEMVLVRNDPDSPDRHAQANKTRQLFSVGGKCQNHILISMNR